MSAVGRRYKWRRPGNHSNCRWTDVCHYKEIKDSHPGWTEKRIQEEYAKDALTLRFGRRYMDLSDYGIDRLEKEIKRDSIAKILTSLRRWLAAIHAKHSLVY